MMSVNEAIMDINKEFQQRKEFYKRISVKAAFGKEERGMEKSNTGGDTNIQCCVR